MVCRDPRGRGPGLNMFACGVDGLDASDGLEGEGRMPSIRAGGTPATRMLAERSSWAEFGKFGGG